MARLGVAQPAGAGHLVGPPDDEPGEQRCARLWQAAPRGGSKSGPQRPVPGANGGGSGRGKQGLVMAVDRARSELRLGERRWVEPTVGLCP